MKPRNSAEAAASAVQRHLAPENALQAAAKRGESHVEDGPAIVAGLHAKFCRYSGLPLALRPEFQRLWWDLYVDRGRDADAIGEDVRIVCVYLRSQIERDKRNPGALRLVNLLQPDQFESDVAEARMMRGKGARKAAGASKTVDAAPPGWRAYLEDQYPDHAADYRDKTFNELPGQLQRACREGCRE
ncbi:MAG TPA: hypothetical protein VIM61_00530 [Chthoniobacterales bacterium]